MTTSQVARLGRGSQIELDRRVDDLSDVVVNGRRVAVGEVVQVHEHFGVRVSSPADDPRSDLLPRVSVADLAPIAPGDGPLDVIHDLALPITVRVGRALLALAEIHALGEGDVISLDRFAGEPCDISVGGERFAEGEVIQVGDRFGVKITNLVGARAAEEEEQ
jgi:flagellar motor switch protein FliN/FliY